MTEDDRINKILALLAKAEKSEFPEEAKAYSAKAQALMTQWEIDEAQVAAAAAATGAPAEVPTDKKVWIPGTMYKASTAQLWYQVLQANGVDLVLVAGERYYENWKKEGYTRPYIRGTYFHLFGFEHNIRMAEMLVASLTIQMETEFRSAEVQSRMFAETSSAPGRVQWKNGFIFGYAAAIGRKLQAAKRETVAASGPGTELVLVRRDELVQQAKTLVYPKLGKSSSSAGQGYNSSRALGREAGNRADVGGTRIAGQNRKGINS